MTAAALLASTSTARADGEPAVPPSPAAPAASAEAKPASSGRDVDVHVSSELGAYADTQHVFVASPTIAAHVASPTAGWSVDGRYLVDVVSAASVDIVSTASSRFQEARHAGTVSGSYKPGDLGVSALADVSSEPDYLAITGGGAVTKDVLHKNVTLLVGYSHGHDVAGRRGTPFSVFSRVIENDDVKAGATFLLGPSSVLSVVGDVIFERGNSSKPYRYVPMFAPGTNVPVGAPIDLVNRLRLSYRPLEQLPLSRDRFAVTGRLAHRAATTTFRLDERLYTDTWGLDATTTDARVLFDLGSRVELGPHARFHIQSPVSFWQRAYTMTGPIFPTLRTGDRELGPLFTVTGGGRLGVFLGPAESPRSLVLGLDLNVAETRYLDDLYLTHRLSTVGGLSLEADF